VKVWNKIYQANGPSKQGEVAILITDKVDFKPQLIRRDKEVPFILIKGAIQEEEITIINLHVPSAGAHIYIKHILMDFKSQIDQTQW
jgi:hypothetical protein